MKIGHGSNPQPRLSDHGTSSAAIAKVGTARLMLTSQVLDTSARRRWASTAATGMATIAATNVAAAHKMTVSSSDARIPVSPVHVPASKNHSKNPMSRGTAVCEGRNETSVAITVMRPCVAVARE